MLYLYLNIFLYFFFFSVKIVFFRLGFHFFFTVVLGLWLLFEIVFDENFAIKK